MASAVVKQSITPISRSEETCVVSTPSRNTIENISDPQTTTLASNLIVNAQHSHESAFITDTSAATGLSSPLAIAPLSDQISLRTFFTISASQTSPTRQTEAQLLRSTGTIPLSTPVSEPSSIRGCFVLSRTPSCMSSSNNGSHNFEGGRDINGSTHSEATRKERRLDQVLRPLPANVPANGEGRSEVLTKMYERQREVEAWVNGVLISPSNESDLQVQPMESISRRDTDGIGKNPEDQVGSAPGVDQDVLLGTGYLEVSQDGIGERALSSIPMGGGALKRWMSLRFSLPQAIRNRSHSFGGNIESILRQDNDIGEASAIGPGEIKWQGRKSGNILNLKPSPSSASLFTRKRTTTAMDSEAQKAATPATRLLNVIRDQPPAVSSRAEKIERAISSRTVNIRRPKVTISRGLRPSDNAVENKANPRSGLRRSRSFQSFDEVQPVAHRREDELDPEIDEATAEASGLVQRIGRRCLFEKGSR